MLQKGQAAQPFQARMSTEHKPRVPPLSWQSVRLRISVLTLSIFLGCLWALIWTTKEHMKVDIEAALFDMQRTALSLHAADLDRELGTRLKVVEQMAGQVSAADMANPARLQEILVRNVLAGEFFNDGYFVTNAQGMALASSPSSVPRDGTDFMSSGPVARALTNNERAIGQFQQKSPPKALPSMGFAVPVRDKSGKTLGAMVGVVDLNQANFLVSILTAPFSSVGHFALVSNEANVVFSANDKALVSQPLLEWGTDMGLAQLLANGSISSKFRNKEGIDVLVSAQVIPGPDWTLAAIFPRDEIHTPLRHLFSKLRWSTALASLLVIGVTWWMLRRQLAPIDNTVNEIVNLIHSKQPMHLLPEVRSDEIGRLVSAFNDLLRVQFKREAEVKRSELQLVETARTLHEAQEISQLGNWSFDLPSGQVIWSDHMYQLFGAEPGSFKPTYEGFLASVHRDDLSMVLAAFQTSMASPEPHQLEHRVVLKGGQVKWVLQRGHTEFGPDGQPQRVIGTVQDITERKLADAELTRSNDLLKNILETIPMRVFWKSKDLIFLGCNTSFARDAGKQTPDELLGKDDFQMGWSEQADLYRADDIAVMSSGKSKLFYEEPQTTPSGEVRWLRVSKIPLKTAEGKVMGVLGMYEDITQQKEREALLRKLSLVAEQSPFTVLISDLQGRIEYVNPAFERNTGFSAEFAVGRTPNILYSGLNSDELYQSLWRTLQDGQPWQGELMNRRKNGSVYLDRAIITPLRSPQGDITHYVSIQEDITDQKKSADELTQHRDHLEKLVTQRTEALVRAEFLNDQALDLAQAGHWSIDLNEGLEYYTSSPKAMEIFGDPPRADFRYHIQDEWKAHIAAVDPVVAEATFQNCVDAVAGRRPRYDAVHPYRRPVDGRVVWVHVMGEIKRNDAGKPTHVYGVVMDVTASRAAEAELRQAKLEAETASRAKSEFLANMSHEIRTPLNAVSGMARLIGQGTLSDLQRERLSKLELAGDHLLRTINNILDLSKIEAGKFELDETGVQIQDVVQSVITILADKAQSKQLRLDSHVDSFPANLWGDQTRLVQALLNLATNAVKFTESGFVSVRATLLEDTQDSVLARFEVEDSGIGIEENDLPRLFESFEQVDSGITRKYGGTGLGLAITKRIAQFMGGQAGLRSTPGEGSVFWFTARLNKRVDIGSPTPDVAPDHWSQTLRTEFSGRKILLAEDDDFNQEIALLLLQDVGQIVELAEDGRVAVEKAQASTCDMVLMDMQMPHMDGLEATRLIRQMPGYANTPIIALTGNAFSEDKTRCLQAGMDDFVTKPIDPEKLYRAMVGLYRNGRQT